MSENTESQTPTVVVVHGHAFAIDPTDTIRLGRPCPYGAPDHEAAFAGLPAGRGR